MKIQTQIVSAFVLLLPFGTMAFEAPSDDAVKGVLSDPASISSIIGDASFNEAADVVVRVFAAVDESALSDSEKTQFIALLVARVMRSFPEKADLAGALLNRVNADWKPIVAAASIAANSDDAVKQALATQTEAVANPKRVLGEALYYLIVGRVGGGTLGSPGGAVQPALLPPPPMGIVVPSTGNIVPPVQDQTPPAQRYNGQ